MQFVFPLFLVALATIIIPVIIHLFYFQRYRTEYFSNVRFLKNLKEEKQTRSRLRNLLVLLSRIFFITFLVLAFAQPFIMDDESASGDKPEYISIFIDNSYSMSALSSETPLFQVAVNKARDIINSYDAGTNFQIISNDLTPGSTQLLSKELALDRLDNISLSHIPSDFERIYRFILRTTEEKGVRANSYWLSDFQRNSIENPIDVDSSLVIFPIPVTAVETRNISIDSCWFESPVPEANVENQLYIKLTNYGVTDQDTKIVLREGGNVNPVGSVFIESGATIVDTIGINISRTEVRDIVIEITDNPVVFDNSYFMSLDARNTLRLLMISEDSSNPYLSSALNNNPTVEKDYVSIDRIVYSDFDNKDLIVLDELPSFNSGLISNLSRYLEQGGNIMVFPGRNSDISTYNALFNAIGAVRMGGWIEQEMESLGINYQDFIFSDVFSDREKNMALPGVNGYYSIQTGVQTPLIPLLTLRNGEPLISKMNAKNGFLYFSSAPLDREWSNVGTHADIFIPMIYRMALSKSRKKKLSYFLGGNTPVTLSVERELTEESIEVTSGENGFIPAYTQNGELLEIQLYDQIEEAGFYDVREKEQIIGSFAMNYSRNESDISTFDADELRDKIAGSVVWVSGEQSASIQQFIQEYDRGKVLWKWCLIFALIFLVVESLLLRFLKN